MFLWAQPDLEEDQAEESEKEEEDEEEEEDKKEDEKREKRQKRGRERERGGSSRRRLGGWCKDQTNRAVCLLCRVCKVKEASKLNSRKSSSGNTQSFAIVR